MCCMIDLTDQTRQLSGTASRGRGDPDRITPKPVSLFKIGVRFTTSFLLGEGEAHEENREGN